MKHLVRRSVDHQRVLARFIDFISANYDQEIDLDSIACATGTSRFHLCRVFHFHTGQTPMRWLWRFRVHLSRELITLMPCTSLTEIAYLCGYSSIAHFSRHFRQAFEQSPSTYRRAFPQREAAGGEAPLTQSEPVLDLAVSHALQTMSDLPRPCPLPASAAL